MALEVITKPAQITEDMSLYLKISIETSNKHIEQMAADLRKSPINNLDPKDGRKAIITLSVNEKTGSIEQNREFILP
ncbi:MULTISPECIES: hypothetical protein [Leeuwenhoekiella]|jgi:hypothetical protein|uniref:hypothetical protein n=1 Tax=Leeuwenhoekiella TaxID=283735 RepID=UPI000C3DEE18|nr:hypothetical protein [Methylophaga sp.]|tara:strand:- start:414 stop:644 length:231 start_codon:yes stop_codon:yes gene_type:complete